MKKHLCLFLLPALMVVLAGCVEKIKSDVVTFHEGELPRGESIRIEPLDPRKKGSLEFHHYATMVTENLRRIGYTPMEGDQPTQLVAELDYSISDGLTEVQSRPGNYVRYHFWYGHYYDPFYYGFHQDLEPEIYAYTVYNRILLMNIVRTDNDKKLYEGRVQSVGPEKEIAKVMPYMITAMFANYPGESGVTKVITIEKK
ncbi:DUF4136 domain-containing protein [Aestuariicella hydrocarbonica]|uniref:DUF4136 domain-containing protein n=1 Tax=Pseudomaricurvus hydrocarbonicus TaxID=1470433 RepID=A0A9E5MM10_9GAMM|nr:DUF4136 domain-containing protein [Aestuariicella hydrocarbonica]NHO65180.1 DUF4136 domain-containing protein [Aestuariicella hydrocarbonica]